MTQSDYAVIGTGVRSTRGGQLASLQLTPITHPNQWNGVSPHHPTYRLYDPADRWQKDRLAFEALLPDVRAAVKWLSGSGFYVLVQDVPEQHRAALVRYAGMLNGNETADFLLGPGWRS